MNEIEFIFYVSNQRESANFYENLLQLEPSLNVPGMTEYKLADNVKLRLMPKAELQKY